MVGQSLERVVSGFAKIKEIEFAAKGKLEILIVIYTLKVSDLSLIHI